MIKILYTDLETMRDFVIHNRSINFYRFYLILLFRSNSMPALRVISIDEDAKVSRYEFLCRR